MNAQKQIVEKDFLDPVFLEYGMEVYSHELIDRFRKENLDAKRKGKRIWNLVPQAGFQEKVLTNLADLIICGGVRGAGKTAISLIGSLYYADNPDVNMYGFRRLEADVKRGIWRSCKPLFRGFATFADTSFEAKFFGGTGATMKMEHLADLKQVKDRFRGAEMPYIVIEELAEFTRESMGVVFDLIGSNRSTAGVRPRFICTCNPVGKSNKLRWFLDWWIDPITDEAIPERSGKLRYFCRYGEDVMEIAWGNTPEEVYANPNAHAKIASMTDTPDKDYKDFITSVTFIDGDYAENEILHVADPKYMNRISAGGSKSTINDIRGVWRDVDDTSAILSVSDMNAFFKNPPHAGGVKCAGGDIALKNDLLVLWAADGYHICDVETKRGLKTETVIPFILEFLKKNEVPIENFCFDVNGIGNWLRESDALAKAIPFDNKAPAKDKLSYTTRKSECAGLLIEWIQSGKLSIEDDILTHKYTRNRQYYTVEEGLIQERVILKWRIEENPKDLMRKKDMKVELGYSPDLMEALIYLVHSIDSQKARAMVRDGFNFFF
jgi:hypothetical protein